MWHRVFVDGEMAASSSPGSAQNPKARCRQHAPPHRGGFARLPDGDCVRVTALTAPFVGAAVWRHEGDALTAALMPAATSTPARVASNHIHAEIIAM
jgi:hypothetical protein